MDTWEIIKAIQEGKTIYGFAGTLHQREIRDLSDLLFEYTGELIGSPHSFFTTQKPQEKLTLYQYTYQNSNGEFVQTNWTNRKWWLDLRLFKTETKEIEVES